jgi:hypothetical protein
MDRKEFAKRLNGRMIGKEMTSQEEREAKESGLLVVYGSSDDLTQMRGVIDEELDAWNGASFTIKRKDGKLKAKKTKLNADRELVKIDAHWCSKHQDISWAITTNVPFSDFTIYDGTDIFCLGLVIQVVDIDAQLAKAANSSKGIRL